jgi:Tol biopolymer transport system component
MKRIMVISLLCLGLQAILLGQDTQPAQLLSQAIYQEQVNGDLDKAIKIYQVIVIDYANQRDIAAEALLHLGLCYEKLGLEEAQKAYRRLIDEYPEQTEIVFKARTRLDGLKQKLTNLDPGPTFRKIRIASNPQNGVLSPDGKKLAFMSEGGVWVIPLQGKVNPDIAGEPVRIATLPNIWEGSGMIAWSGDGNWIAVYGGSPDSEEGSIVSVIPAKGGALRMVRLPDQGGHLWSYRLSLSPDGQRLTFSALETGKSHGDVTDSHERSIYTIPVAGGQPEKVSSGWARLPSFSPDGKFIAYVGYRHRSNWQENDEDHRIIGDLYVVHSEGGRPVKLANVDGRLRGPVWSPDGRFIAGHLEPGGSNASKELVVYELSGDGTSAQEIEKIMLPRNSWRMLAGWTPEDELGVFIETVRHSAIYTVPASGGKAVQVVPDGGGPYYPRWSNDGERIYFRGFTEEEEKVLALFVPASGGDPIEVHVESERKLVSIIPGGGLNISPDDKNIVMCAYQVPYIPDEGCDLWTISMDGTPPNRLTNDPSFEGYPCWSPDGKSIAFIDWIEDPGGEEFRAIFTIPAKGGVVKQISTKTDSVTGGAIAYSPDGRQIAFFSGSSIRSIATEGGPSVVLVKDIKSGRHSDLAFSPDGTKIAHNDYGKIWITSLPAGESQELHTGLISDARLTGFSWSPDGKKIAFLGETGGDLEFWLIGNFLPRGK